MLRHRLAAVVALAALAVECGGTQPPKAVQPVAARGDVVAALPAEVDAAAPVRPVLAAADPAPEPLAASVTPVRPDVRVDGAAPGSAPRVRDLPGVEAAVMARSPAGVGPDPRRPGPTGRPGGRRPQLPTLHPGRDRQRGRGLGAPPRRRGRPHQRGRQLGGCGAGRDDHPVRAAVDRGVACRGAGRQRPAPAVRPAAARGRRLPSRRRPPGHVARRRRRGRRSRRGAGRGERGRRRRGERPARAPGPAPVRAGQHRGDHARVVHLPERGGRHHPASTPAGWRATSSPSTCRSGNA